ncbi:hypothetical protein RIF29_11329 [Crotalaria pallida]|uniref:Uncharacterized protein n=1 Tax=Crotalaria pallida TaxID=3830 RepID=A0AAN9P151_CROPI
MLNVIECALAQESFGDYVDMLNSFLASASSNRETLVAIVPVLIPNFGLSIIPFKDILQSDGDSDVLVEYVDLLNSHLTSAAAHSPILLSSEHGVVVDSGIPVLGNNPRVSIEDEFLKLCPKSTFASLGNEAEVT